MKRFLGNVPILVAALFTTAFSLDLPILEPLKTETGYGIFVTILVPATVGLILLQGFLWAFFPWARPVKRKS